MTRGPADGELEAVRRQLADERAQLAGDIAALRGGVGVSERVSDRLPLLAVAVFAASFVLAGGLGAAARLVARRGREGRDVARLGRYVLVDRG